MSGEIRVVSFAAIQARLMMLISMQYDIELQTQFIMQHRMFLQQAVNGFMDMKAEYEPNTRGAQILQARIHQLTSAEKVLEMRYTSLQNRAKAIQQEREGITQALNQNIQRSFRNPYGGSG